MAKLKLVDGTTYELVANGVIQTEKEIRLIFLPRTETFETVESKFTASNTQTIYILDSMNDPIRSLTGYTKYKGMEKRSDYVVSTEMVNVGSEEEPIFENKDTIDTVMIITLVKPNIEDRIQQLEETNSEIKQAAVFAAFSFTDQQAVRIKNVYPQWGKLPNGTQLTKQEEAVSGLEITKVLGNDGLLYKVITTHQKQADWEPGKSTETLFVVINEEHEGTRIDPIPYSVNMIVYQDKYYTYNETLYRCTRDSGIALQYTPDQLINQYFVKENV